jgi:hypothetical protein
MLIRPVFRLRRSVRLVALLAVLLGCLLLVPGARAQTSPPVLIAPIRGTIDLGLAAYLTRVLDAAEAQGAAAVVVVEAEALVPAALAEAFRGGRLGVMDYYKMQNVQADTGMRNTLAGNGEHHEPVG